MNYRMRRLVILLIIAAISLGGAAYSWLRDYSRQPQNVPHAVGAHSAQGVLATLPTKGRAPKTDYRRSQFGPGWQTDGICDTRNRILQRDLRRAAVNNQCKVTAGELNDPYTGETHVFRRGSGTSDKIQIDHVVALSNAWQTGAQQLAEDERIRLANDPLNLLAVKGAANQDKGDSDAATWLPQHKPFRCQYVARQIAVKAKYRLWVTAPERQAMEQVLATCPGQAVPQP
ncbi:HNH endonuclease [Candidatus Saccharibacteria bacterium]|nr:HNH endonuclease [Candidatus Saccharibacteria bacterium]